MKLNKFGSLGAGGASPRSVTINGTYPEFRRADVFAVEIVDLVIVHNEHRQVRVSDERNVNWVVSIDTLKINRTSTVSNMIVSMDTLEYRRKVNRIVSMDIP